jgi:glyceraldehyde-3-phosphate dehydrogenase (NADP+)
MIERAPYLEGDFRKTGDIQEIRSPYDASVVARVHLARAEEAEQALAFAHRSRGRLAAQSTAKRMAVLSSVAAALAEREEALAQVICLEAGKPIALARGEVRRAVATFTLAAAELTRPSGEAIPIDLDAGSEGFDCVTRRVPAGVVVGITPFNFPLNLGAHKVAPALAVGAPILWKPPPQAPSAALLLAELVRAADADPAALAVLPCNPAVAEGLASDRRVRVLSFTGSARVGWHLLGRSRARTVLELGGNAGVVVCEDADLDHAAARCALGGVAFAGQSCISVQRVFAQERIFSDFAEKLSRSAAALKAGDPRDESVTVGPVIDDRAAERIVSWIEEAKAQGARVLLGGGRKGTLVETTLVTSVPKGAKLCREEVFGPVVVVEPYGRFEEALDRVNDSEYGLQAAVFTFDLRRVREAFRALEVGGLIVNEMPTFRSDSYPYGGVKGSGLGREGVRSAMEELTEPRVLVLGR